MAQINFASREVNCKIVYYGPGRSGKTTNLEVVHSKAPKESTGEMVSIATETDRTLFFDFLPLDLGMVAGMRTKFQLYTVPGQVYYNATRKLVLQGSDGVVFVADSQKSMREENIESLQNLEENLKENGLNIDEISLVFQWNKRDLEDLDTSEELNSYLNRWGSPSVEAVAPTGEGVFKTLKTLSSMVIKKLNQDQSPTSSAATPASPAAPAPTPAPVPTAKKQANIVAAASGKPAPETPAPAPAAKPAFMTQAAAKPVKQAETKPETGKTKPAVSPEATTVKTPIPKKQATVPVAAKNVTSVADKKEPVKQDNSVSKAKPVAISKPKEQKASPPPVAQPPQKKPAEVKPEPSQQSGANPVARELKRKKAEREERERSARERIKAHAKKPVQKGDSKKSLILGGLALIIVIAIILTYLHFI